VPPEDLPLALDRQDARPLAVQLTDELRAAAGCGAVRVGDRLPSTRALATTLASAAGHRGGVRPRHLRRVRRELLARRDLLVGTLRAADLSVRGDQAGAHLVVDLPGEEAERSAVRCAECEGLLLDGLARCYDGPSSRYGVALGYAGLCNRPVFAAVLPGLTAVLAAAQGPPGRR
jgi:DNA-binding transcriptional MocR family regulator